MNFKMQHATAVPDRAATAPITQPQRILFVCLGNICRSPSAQGIFSHLAAARPGQERFLVDSAGTHDYHVGKAPDARAIAAAGRAGVDISGQRARQFSLEDFERFDHILVMDERNRSFVTEMCPPGQAHKVKAIIGFTEYDLVGVPDPFHGEETDFDEMVELLFDVCGATLDALNQHAAYCRPVA